MHDRPGNPYLRALGDRSAELHPRLNSYFAPLPDGLIGVGEGVFSRVGTPRRWLWPLLRPLHAQGVIYAGWQLSVPFRVTNRLIDGRVIAEREFLLPGDEWTMRDAVSLKPHGRLVDELGADGDVAASFTVDVQDGALVMTSHAVGIRLGRISVRLPRLIAPVVRLTERFDDAVDRQRVSVTIDMPVLGRIYEYAGDFVYRIQKETA